MAAVQATAQALDPSNSSKKTIKIENTEKRDSLIAQEKKYQKIWQDSGLFEPNAPSIEEVPSGKMSSTELHNHFPKFFGTMAYPYMNGTLHAGHSFTMSKVEFATGVSRMQGKRSLFPLGYHCTGMPIKVSDPSVERACADKLVREIEMFGEKFEGCPESAITNGENEEEPPAPTQSEAKADITKFSAKKSKAAAKTVKMKYQFQIMLAIGIPLGEIHKFADPQYWLIHFPPLCKQHLTNFGCRIDWRRSFVTTPANPFYDAFVRWQMNRLHEMGKIKFGKRYTVYSPKDGQACMDHDRSEGEGVGVQEYTALRMQVKEWSEKAKEKLANKLPSNSKVYFVPATLRPETMYGQTAVFVGPKITYGLYQVSEDELYLITDRAARNMAYQSIFKKKWGETTKVADLVGSDVLGTLVNAPLSVYTDGIRVLPMESIKPTKGTGVVTNVPSDSPDDYATITDLAKKADFYGIKKEWASLEILPILSTPSYGDISAKFLVEKMKINSPKDVKQLAEAKDLAYKEGFYKGTMLVGDFKGQPVSEAKPKVKSQLIDAGEAFEYAEPDGHVVSRSGDVCVAGHLDQWYLNYGSSENGGDGEWLDQVLGHIDDKDGVNLYSTEAKNAFESTLNWLGQWACARTYGLGSLLPFDHNFLVESLSDSTIYMSYYTIAHLLHRDIFGKELGPANIKPDQMTDEIWDYIFTRREDVKTDIPMTTLQRMRREFEYWYPLDVRISGKDLINNHLSFFLYVHIALFPKQYWPRAVRVNGHLLLNSEKMSKSTGNFLTLSEATEKFGADATRIALADAGDSLDDSNFEETTANASILKLFELRKYCEDTIRDAHMIDSPEKYVTHRDEHKVRNTDTILRTGQLNFFDKVFQNEMNGLVHDTRAAYEATLYKSALKMGFYDFTAARDWYRESTKTAEVGMHKEINKLYIKLQALMLLPIAPHWSEYIWTDVLGNSESVQNAQFPIVADQDVSLTAAREYMRSTSSNITSAEGAAQKKVAKGKTTAFDPKKDKKISVFTASSFPAWQDRCVELVRQNLDGMTFDMKAVSKDLDKSETRKAMPFVQGLKKRLEGGEDKQSVFERRLPFDELVVLKEMVPGLKASIQRCKVVEVINVEDGGKRGRVVAGNGAEVGEERTALPQSAEGAMPGAPTYHFENMDA